jgi:hypothetical protein
MSNDDDDFDVEDILGNLNKKDSKKKKINSKRKGNNGELDLILSLTARFPGKTFFRVVGSGNRGSQVSLGEHKEMFTGDIVCPPNFKFTIECKYGYDGVEMLSFFPDGHRQVNEWIKQAARDAGSLNKQPLLCWRKPRQPWLAFIKWEMLQAITPQPLHHMRYKDYGVLSLSSLLTQPDEFWFKS